jgi:hypothetical protein
MCVSEIIIIIIVVVLKNTIHSEFIIVKLIYLKFLQQICTYISCYLACLVFWLTFL